MISHKVHGQKAESVHHTIRQVKRRVEHERGDYYLPVLDEYATSRFRGDAESGDSVTQRRAADGDIVQAAAAGVVGVYEINRRSLWRQSVHHCVDHLRGPARSQTGHVAGKILQGQAESVGAVC